MTPRPPAETDLESVGRPIVIASHPRSGTHLLMDTFRLQFSECRSWKWPGESLGRLYMNIDSLFDAAGPGLTEAQALRILRRSRRPLIKTHSLPGLANWPRAQQLREPPARWLEWFTRSTDVCYVVRDGRSVMSSYHQYVRGFDASAGRSIGEFLREQRGDLSRLAAWSQHVRRWTSRPGVVVVRFEDLVARPEEVITSLAESFALTLRPGVARRVARRSRNRLEGRLSRLLSTRPESSAVLGAEGGAKPQPWRESFTREDRAYFAREAGDLLIQHGYEESDAWVDGD